MIGTWRTVEKKGLDNSQFTLTGGVYEMCIRDSTLTIEGDGYSFGTYTVNVEGISNDENKTFGTIKFVVKSATVDQNNTVTIGADFQSSQDTSDVYLNWQNMNIEVANDGDTSTSTGSVTVKLGEHNRVTWNEVSYNTSNGIKKKLETCLLYTSFTNVSFKSSNTKLILLVST